MKTTFAPWHLFLIVLLLACVAASILSGMQATQPSASTQSGTPPPTAGTRRLIPVTNVVPTGAAEFKGTIIRLEVIEAIDARRGSDGRWRTRIALRVKNPRNERVRCTIAVYFDGELFDTLNSVDLPAGETDLALIQKDGGDGKRASQLAKLTAEARSIRVGE